MTSGEITAEVLRRGLIQTRGNTPERTMSAALYTAANQIDPPVRRLAEPGPNRARRGTVRWATTWC